LWCGLDSGCSSSPCFFPCRDYRDVVDDVSNVGWGTELDFSLWVWVWVVCVEKFVWPFGLPKQQSHVRSICASTGSLLGLCF
jgi:hypothetical protein